MKSAAKPGGSKKQAAPSSPIKKSVVPDADSSSSSSSSSSSASASNSPRTPRRRGSAVNVVTPPNKAGAGAGIGAAAAAAGGAGAGAGASPSPSSRSKSPVKKRGGFGSAARGRTGAGAGTGAGAAIAGEDDEAGSPQKLVTEMSPKVELAYKIIRKSTGALGGNGTTGAIYGELTMGSMQKVLNYLKEHCALTNQSRFIDVGSGLGKPNFHAAQDPVVRLSLGVELEAIRRQLAMKNLSDVLKQSSDAPNEGPESDVKLHSSVYFLHMDIDQATTLNPFTHIYMYDLGFPPDLQESIADKFNKSTYAEWFISYRPPRRVIEEYGYEVEFVKQMMTSMHGSGEGHTVYFYKRAVPLVRPPAAERQVTLSKRAGIEEDDAVISCDAAFVDAAKLATASVADLRQHADASVAEHLASERPRRERRPRVLD